MKELSFCMHCHKKTGNKNIHISMVNGRKVQKSNCVICNSKKSTFLPNTKKNKVLN